MTTPKLTDAQARILKAMQEGAVLARHKWSGSYMLAGERVREATVDSLLDKGCLTRTNDYRRDITPAGADALAAWEAQ